MIRVDPAGTVDAMPAGLREAVAAIPDPEVPVLTIEDLGVLRSVELIDGRVIVTITPTYSGCPAMAHIERQIESTLEGFGVAAEIRTVFSPAWTTEWMSADGRRKLGHYGVAAPHHLHREVPIVIRAPVTCPRCDSEHTVLVSEFGSTACKALYRCGECGEPFDYFKEI